MARYQWQLQVYGDDGSDAAPGVGFQLQWCGHSNSSVVARYPWQLQVYGDNGSDADPGVVFPFQWRGHSNLRVVARYPWQLQVYGDNGCCSRCVVPIAEVWAQQLKCSGQVPMAAPCVW